MSVEEPTLKEISDLQIELIIPSRDLRPVQRKKGQVTVVDTSTNLATVLYPYDDVGTPGHKWMPSYVPFIGDWVIVDVWGNDRMILGSMDPLYSDQEDVATGGTTTSTGYTDTLTTGGAGPSFDLFMVKGHLYLITVQAVMSSSNAGGFAALMAPAITGPGTSVLAALDINGAKTQSDLAVKVSASTLWAPLETGIHNCKGRYKVINATTGTFNDRRLIVKA
jgi:hypothetical protein